MDEIRLAQRIIENSYHNIRDTAYHENSFIYRASNEQIINYQHHLQKKEKVLSVIGSGNQILNTILEGTTEIDGFDISCFPKHYLSLQLAAVEKLDKEDYLDFFYGDITTEEKYDDMYLEIKKSLKKDEQQFWDHLFHFYDWYDIINSTLFSKETVFKNTVVEQNKYLQAENYQKLKRKIPNINLTCYQGDIEQLGRNLSNQYDFINLSSIIYYKPLEDYMKMLELMPLTESGIALTYLYDMTEKEILNKANKNHKLEMFTDQKSGVMIYQKRK